jgi:hypothetical protein
MAGGHGGAREGSGKPHLLKGGSTAVAPINGARARTDKIIADGEELPAEMLVEAARFELGRARKHAARADELRAAGDIDGADRFEEGTSKLYAIVANHAAKAAPYFHAKLASVEHTGGSTAPLIQGGVNVTVLNLFGALAESKAKAAAVIEGKIINPDGTPFHLPGAGGTQLEDVAAAVIQRIQDGATRLGLSPPEQKPDGS